MGQKRFGPVKAAGVAVVEQTSGQTISPADMGVAVHLGMYESGKPNDLSFCPSQTSFTKKMGSRFTGSTAPDAAEDYFSHGQGAGELICVRVTDGTEVVPYLDLYTRHWGTDFYASTTDKDGQAQMKIPCLRIKAKNGGRWGGRQRYLRSAMPTDVATNLAETTLNTGLTMLADEWVGATLSLDGVASKTYEVLSNTAVGVVTVKSDSAMKTDMGASVDKDYELTLTNLALTTGGHKSIAVEVVEGQEPATEFGLKVYRDGVLVKMYSALSIDPSAAHYVEDVVNNDTGNDEIEVDDLLAAGTTITPDHRPAIFYGRLKTLGSTKATFNVVQVAAVDDSATQKVVGISFPAGADPWPHRLTFTWDATANKYTVKMAPIGLKQVYFGTYSGGNWNLPDFSVGNGVQWNKTYTADNTHTVSVTVDHPAEPATGKAFVLDVLPLPDGLPVDGQLASVAKTKNLTRFNISASDYESVTCDSSAMSAVSAVAAYAQATGSVKGTYNIGAGANDAMVLAIDGSADVAVTLTPGAARTAAQVVADINTTISTAYGAGFASLASVYTDAAGDTYVRIRASNLTDKWSRLEFKTVAASAYSTLGLSVGVTLGTPGQAPALARVTGAIKEPVAGYVVGGLKLIVTVDGRQAVTTTLAVGNKTAQEVAAAINADYLVAYGAGAPQPASLYTDSAGDKFVRLTSPWYEGGGPGSIVRLGSVAGSAYAALGFMATATTGQTLYGVAGDETQVFFSAEAGGGYDGGVPADQDYVDMLSVSASPIRKLIDKGKGVVSIACPDKTSSTVQKAGIAYAEAHNHLYVVTFPDSLATEQSIVDWINDTIGRSDHAAPFFPSFAKVNDPDKDGVLKQISLIGAIQGQIARYAKNYSGYHWPAAGIEAKLSRVVELPSAVKDVELNDELLTPQGVNLLKKKKGNYVVWGARTQWINSDWQYLTHRLQMSHYEHSLQEGYDWVIFQLNDQSLWGVLYTSLVTFFMPEFAKGALKGKNFSDACLLKIDSENNTAITEAAGDVNVEIGLKFPYFAERLVIKIGKQGLFEGTSA